MEREERKSCDLTDFILNEFESRLTENKDMDSDNTSGCGEINPTFVNIDMNEACDKVQPPSTKKDSDNVDLQSIDISPVNGQHIPIEQKDSTQSGSSSDGYKENQQDHNSNHVKFSFEDTIPAKVQTQQVPLAWNLLSKKRKNTQKKKKTKWAKVRDNLKIVNFMRSVTTADVSRVKRDLEHNPFLTTFTDDSGISALERAVNSKSLDIVKLFIDNTSKAHKGDFIEHAILYAIKMDCVATVTFLLDEREKFWKAAEEESTPSPKENRSLSLPFQRLLNFKMKEADATDPKAKELRADGVGILMSGVTKKKEELCDSKEKERTGSAGNLTPYVHRKKSAEDVPTVLPGFEDAEFSSYTTPIILAAKLERLDSIKLLIEKDASEIHPMTMPCPYEYIADCDICNEKKLFKRSRNLEDSNHIIEIYRALSSPAYIFLSGVADPVLEAFVLSRELDEMQEEDPSFKFEYAELSKKCRLFAEELLGLCRTTDEVETMLRREEGVKDIDRAGARTGLSRVIVAMNYDQKEFIAHPYCQQVLQKSWYKGLPQWVHETEYHYTSLFSYCLLWALIWPAACILFMLKIWPWLINIMKTPLMKFITDTCSYLTFLLCILLNSICFDHSMQRSGDFFNSIEILIILWITGLLARQFKMFWRHRNAWKKLDFVAVNRDTRWSDVVIAIFFTVWAILRLAGFIYALASDTDDETRGHWHQYHPILVAEAFYCAGTVVAFTKLTSLFITSSTLGPMQISLKRMITDILRFLSIFIVIMIGFIVAIKTLYSNYANNSFNDSGDTIYQSEEYVGFKNTINTLFWHIFGYGDVQFANIVVNTTHVNKPHLIQPQQRNIPHINGSVLNSTVMPNNQNGTKYVVINKHTFTEGVGYTLVGTYHIVILIVLLNMLIAMMNNSYQAIVEDSDTEWKFARTRLRMTYYNEVGSLPPPFNVWILGTIMKYVIRCCGKCSIYCKQLEEKTQENLQGSVHREKKSEYKDLMEKIHKRFWNKKTSRLNKEIVIAPDTLENLLRGGRKSQLYGSESHC